MKLFLSSIRLPYLEERAKLFGDKKDISVVIVPDAWDPYPEARRNAETAETVSEFETLGYKTSVLHLASSTDRQREESLHTNDLLWVTGGNTFYLNYYVQTTGFSTLIKEAISRGLVYGGASAGAIVSGPTLHGSEYADNPNDAPEVIWDGMQLIDFSIVPHWGMEKYAAVLEKIKAAQQPYASEVITLTNKQALTLVDGAIEIV